MPAIATGSGGCGAHLLRLAAALLAEALRLGARAADGAVRLLDGLLGAEVALARPCPRLVLTVRLAPRQHVKAPGVAQRGGVSTGA